MSKCKYCQSEIDPKAIICLRCNRDQRDWAARHKVLTGLLYFAGIGLLFLVLAALSTHNSQQSNAPTSTLPSGNTTTMTQAPTNTLDAFKQSYRSSFITQCEQSAGNGAAAAALCTCTGNYMVDFYTDTDLTEMTAQYEASGQLPSQLNDALKACESTQATQ